jgi:hypothetical protein
MRVKLIWPYAMVCVRGHALVELAWLERSNDRQHPGKINAEWRVAHP